MFCGCSNLESVDFSNFKSGKIENVSYMFYNCFNLGTLKIYLHVNQKAKIGNAFAGVKNCNLETDTIGKKIFKK